MPKTYKQLIESGPSETEIRAVLFDGCNYRSLLFTNPLFRGLFHF